MDNSKSTTFTISTGTRQGGVASPILWCLYCDNMLKELRATGIALLLSTGVPVTPSDLT